MPNGYGYINDSRLYETLEDVYVGHTMETIVWFVLSRVGSLLCIHDTSTSVTRKAGVGGAGGEGEGWLVGAGARVDGGRGKGVSLRPPQSRPALPSEQAEGVRGRWASAWTMGGRWRRDGRRPEY